MVGAARVRHTMRWLRALCRHTDGLCTRRLLDPAAEETRYTIVVDASPYGGGGFLADGGVPTEWFSTTWGAEDEEHLRVVVGSHRFQSTFEALALLVAVRAWAHLWTGAPSIIQGRSDAMAAIGAFHKGRSQAPAMNAVVRELNLDIASTPHGFALELRHLPGERNQWADSLSRLMEPGSGAVVPGPLRAFRRREVSARGTSWWRAGGVAAEEVDGQVGDSVGEQETGVRSGVVGRGVA